MLSTHRAREFSCNDYVICAGGDGDGDGVC